MNQKLSIALIVCVVLGGLVFWKMHKSAPKETSRQVTPFYGRIESFVTATGVVQPQNRLEIKPPIGGRIEQILVKEGQAVKRGDVLAIMSSTDRAVLMDAARLQGPDAIKQWESVYKPTPLLAPIDGEVIVKSVNPGQTVITSDPIVVLSDRLIVQAQVDETDVGKVKLGQKASVSLDAYPEIKVQGTVDHIYYESKVVNNVTIYQVDILPETVPDVFRSGMSANVQIIQEQKDHALLIPKEAVKKRDDKNFVFLAQDGDKPLRQEVTLGASDDTNVEILSGLTENDKVVIRSQKMSTKGGSHGSSSPFMPGGGGANRRSSTR